MKWGLIGVRGLIDIEKIRCREGVYLDGGTIRGRRFIRTFTVCIMIDLSKRSNLNIVS